MSETLLVVPCYNEARRLPRDEFLRFARENPDTGFLFVNDGSSDETLAVLEQLASELPQAIDVLDQQPNRGKAEAVRVGLLAALAKGPRFAGFWDADLATPLSEVPRFIEVFAEYPEVDFVFGSRVRLMGHKIDRRLSRHLRGRVFATAASLTLGLPVYDTQCGAKMFRTGPDVATLLEEPWLSRWIFDVELIARLVRDRKNHDKSPVESVLRELPLRQWRDVEGSKLKGRDFFNAIFDLLSIYRRYLA